VGGHRARLAHLARYSPTRLTKVLCLGALLLVAACVLSALYGGVPLHLADALAGRGADGTILLKLRIPRIVLAALVGAALCASGATLQSLLQNPLADPFVLGVSGGAAVGGTAALLLGEWLAGAHLARQLAPPLAPMVGGGVSLATAFGFAGALGAVALVRLLAAQGGRISAAAALLAGAVLNAMAGALVLLAELAISPERAQQILFWLSGSFGYPSWPSLLSGGAAIVLGCAILCALAGRLRLMALGIEEAAQLGVDVTSTARWALAAASLAVASAVALSGLIGFVGLLVPHLLRLWLGPDQRLLLPSSVIFGAAFLVATDGVARLAFLPVGVEPPVGAVTALLGGPLFLVLLRRELRASAT
jgi:iron complex transport system permease protein